MNCKSIELLAGRARQTPHVPVDDALPVLAAAQHADRGAGRSLRVEKTAQANNHYLHLSNDHFEARDKGG